MRMGRELSYGYPQVKKKRKKYLIDRTHLVQISKKFRKIILPEL
ncbi:MAG: hypothetical protein U9M97_04160 [Candidatus Hadarchaeota archaeon]|nr:hypothetical protein [Candidatus Hadarchaeota archaeon]